MGSDPLASIRGTLPDPQNNIVLRVLEGLRTRAGTTSGATIRLLKRIPSAAGLGGASSDAAAALLAANHVWQLGWTIDRLTRFAAEYGSDIPFFMYGSSAICRGRGERVQPVDGLGGLGLVIVRPPTGLATRDVYHACRVPDQPRRVDAAYRGLRMGRWKGSMFNRLQQPAQQLDDSIARLGRALDELDCCEHQMTGSGTSYFGLCRTARHARRVASRLRATVPGSVFVATTVSVQH